MTIGDSVNQPEQQMRLPGGPAPTQTAVVGPVDTPEGKRIGLLISSLNGDFAFYLDAIHAKTLAAQLEMAATQVETGLIIPSTPLLHEAVS